MSLDSTNTTDTMSGIYFSDNSSAPNVQVDFPTTEATILAPWIVFGLCVIVNIALAVQAIRKYNIFRLLAVFAGITTLVLAATLLATMNKLVNFITYTYIDTIFQIISFDLFVIIFIQLGVRFYPVGMAFTPVCLLTITSAITVNCLIVFTTIENTQNNPQPILTTCLILGEIVTNFLTAYYVFSPLVSTIQGKIAGNAETFAVGLWYITILSLLNLGNMIFTVIVIGLGNQFDITNICIGYLFRMSELLAYTLPPLPCIKASIRRRFFGRTSRATTPGKSYNNRQTYPQRLNSLELNRMNTADSTDKPSIPTVAHFEHSPKSSQYDGVFSDIEMGSPRSAHFMPSTTQTSQYVDLECPRVILFEPKTPTKY